mgnify:CR=1 FL=1
MRLAFAQNSRDGIVKNLPVKDYFVLNGINASRISVKSFGEEKLLSDGIDEASHSKNRRAEIN